MIATWMLYSIAFGLLVVAAAHALDRAARVNGIPARYLWAAALAAALVLPFVMPRIDALTPASSVGVSAGQPAAAAPVEFTAEPSAAMRLQGVVAGIDRPLVFAWLVLSSLLLLRVIVAAVVLWRARRRWVEREIHGVSLFVTPDLGPAVVAIPDTRIIVPQWVLSLDPAALATVIRHERQHSAAGDPWLIFGGTLAAALFPWNPAVWYLRRRLRLAIEMDCDARVLAEDPRVDRYGSLLLAIAQHPRLAPRLAVMLTESTSDLERRINAMTAQPPKRPRLRAALLVATAAVAAFVACAMPAPDLVAPRETPMKVTSGDVYLDSQVERPASAHPANQPPRYPDQLRRANIGGQVYAKFVIDTMGQVDMRTVEMVKSDHDQFAAAIREHLPTMRFFPAQVGGRKVKQLVQMPFAFHVMGANDYAVTQAPPVATRRRTSPAELKLDEQQGPKTNVFEEVPVTNARGEATFATPLRSNVPPTYPAELRAKNIQGYVSVRFTVTAEGTVDMSSFTVLRSDHPQFLDAVRTAVAKYRFTPPKKGGVPVASTMEMPFGFSLSK